MKKRVYGVLGISCIKSNFNADFTGMPRRDSEDYYASNLAGKYVFRNYWDKNGYKVFSIKSFKSENSGKKIRPRQIKERYEYLFNKKLTQDTNGVVLSDLFTCVDIQNFGVTFAESKNNLSVTGAVQFTEGFNKWEGSETIINEVLSPFTNSNKSNSEQTTIGSRAFLNEAHFFYGFSIFPENYNEYIDNIKGFKGYTDEAYEAFKCGCLYGTDSLKSTSKAGCSNEFAMFVECKEGSKEYMSNLQRFIQFYKEDETEIIDLIKLINYLACYKEIIDKIEIYYNQFTTELRIDNQNQLPISILSLLDRERI